MQKRRTLAQNLQKRFPDVPFKEISEALKECNDHGGRATSLLTKKYSSPHNDEAEEEQKEEEHDELVEAVGLLKEFKKFDKVPVVPAEAAVQLMARLPDLPDTVREISLLRNRGDLERAVNWLWGTDAGAGWRRTQATDISSWLKTSGPGVASFKNFAWRKSRIVLGQKYRTYAYCEEQFTEFKNSDRDVVNGMTRRVKAGGKWAIEAHDPGFTLVLCGTASTEEFDPLRGIRLDISKEDHEMIISLHESPFGVCAAAQDLAHTDLMKRRFRELDYNKDGKLDVGELRSLLNVKGREEMSATEVQTLFDHVDKDGSGSINFDEFVDFLYPSSSAKKKDEIDGSWLPESELRKRMSVQ